MYLLACKKLEKVNSESMAYFVAVSLNMLHPIGIQDERILLMYPNAALYKIAAGGLLKVFYKNFSSHDLYIAGKVQ